MCEFSRRAGDLVPVFEDSGVEYFGFGARNGCGPRSILWLRECWEMVEECSLWRRYVEAVAVYQRGKTEETSSACLAAYRAWALSFLQDSADGKWLAETAETVDGVVEEMALRLALSVYS